MTLALLDIQNEIDFRYIRHLEQTYGIDEFQYNRLLNKQGMRCAVCGATDARSKNGHLGVDHCHATGAIRGLLCLACNVAIGKLGDDVAGLLRALRYLLQFHGCDSIADFSSGRFQYIRVHVNRQKRQNGRPVELRLRYIEPETGRQISRSAKTRDLAEAKQRALEWQHDLNACFLARGQS